MSLVRQMDWVLFSATLPLLFAGLITMYSFVGENYFFERQVLWIAISLGVFFALSTVDYRFLRRGGVLVVFYLAALLSLVLLAIFGELVRGSQSWFNLGIFSIQPADFMKILLIIILAKYFSRRHIEIAHVRHILVSGVYAFFIFILVFLQPDFGGAMVIFGLWLGMVLISGISKKHLAAVMLGGLFAGTDEAPGEIEDVNGVKMKVYRGMGSIDAMQKGSSDRYLQSDKKNSGEMIAEGVIGYVPYKGPVKNIIYQLVGGLKQGLGYCGAKNILELRKKAEFVRISPAGLRESHPHSLQNIKQAPNYKSEFI